MQAVCLKFGVACGSAETSKHVGTCVSCWAVARGMTDASGIIKLLHGQKE